MKTGGMVNMTALKNTKQRQNDAYETGIGTQFNAETNKRDEDEEMYVCVRLHVVKKSIRIHTDLIRIYLNLKNIF